MGRISRVYEALGYSESGFAKRLGVSPVTVKRWDNGNGNMSMNTIRVMHNAFGLSYEYLMGTGKATGNEKIDRIIAMQEEIAQIRKELLK